jgi:PleD family two-component response regulator
LQYYRALVADRNATFLEKTAEILDSNGIQMIPVNNGRRVLTLCRHEQPDFALLNIDLVGLPGTEACQQVKAQLDPALPIALMFPEDNAEVEKITSQFQADNYLIRPLKQTELLFCARSLLKLRKLLQEKAAGVQIFGRSEERVSGMVSLDMFYTFMRLEILRVERYGFPLSLLYAGIDPLPEDGGAWSNTLNHQLGPTLAQTMRSCLRDIDLSALTSPREMVVIMPHTDSNGARLAADRLCKSISTQAYHFGRVRIQPTLSVGGACLQGDRVVPEDFLALVKSYRDRAAEAGGNRFYIR